MAKYMKISVTEFAKLRNVTRQAILKSIKNNKPMVSVKKTQKVGNTYVLTVEI